MNYGALARTVLSGGLINVGKLGPYTSASRIPTCIQDAQRVSLNQTRKPKRENEDERADFIAEHVQCGR
jgi:hypothetical protein